jgi:hypothetical protein
MDMWTHCGGFDLVGINILVFHQPAGQVYKLENPAVSYVA